MLGKGNAFALYGMADDRGRPVRLQWNALKQRAQRGNVMAVDVGGGKSERAPLVEQRLEILDVTGEAGGLNLVVVDDSGEIGQLVLARAHGRLPHRPLVDLAVAHDHEDDAV